MLPKTYSENGVTLYMHPRRNLRFYRVADATRGFYAAVTTEEQQWAAIVIDRFTILEAQTIEPCVEAPDDSAFAMYFNGRDGLALRERFDLFEQLFTVEDLNLIYRAYNATRENPLPLELPDDVNGDDEHEKKDMPFAGGSSKLNGSNPPDGVIKNETPNGLTEMTKETL